MPDFSFFLYFFLGIFGGALSGLVGIGGGIIMFPLLLYAPQLFGLASLGVKAAAAVTSIQSLTGAASGAIRHHSMDMVSWRVALFFGGPMSLYAFLGSLYSDDFSSESILLIFAGMAIAASFLVLFPARDSLSSDLGKNDVAFSEPKALLSGTFLGFLSGLIGQGGGFLFVPVMMRLLGIPFRVAIGTALAVGVMSSLSVVAGRIGTDQVPVAISLFTAFGALVGAQIGSALSLRTKKIVLQRILAFVILATAGKMLWEVFSVWAL